NKTRHGQRAAEKLWVDHEFDMLCRLHAAGCDVPAPIAATGNAILMEYVGDGDSPARQLRELRLSATEAQRLFDRLMWNVRMMLINDVVHADLSPYNILVTGRRPIIIDLPQAVDARANANARDLLTRDIDNLCQHFARFGVAVGAAPIAQS